ncbi:MAG: 30S ribosomal protein S20 [Phascolarctobacterium sp.]|nr:30S ribosomal protein S20 [Candidatus Phascolarctobacterium caballi]
MPNIKSSIRSVKTDAKRNAQNTQLKSAVHTASRKVKTLAEAGKTEEAKAALKVATGLIDKAAHKNVIHKNNAARKKSNLAKKVNGK